MQDNKRAKGEAGGIPVFCAFDKIVPVGEVKPNPKNPNQHPEEQIDLLAKIIRAQGWRAPVTVSTCRLITSITTARKPKRPT